MNKYKTFQFPEADLIPLCFLYPYVTKYNVLQCNVSLHARIQKVLSEGGGPNLIFFLFF